ncbi:MAG: hypothetical protein M0P31_09790 [Solirubrobacteraceae bacterium]|nr:hypothetical protein [Solirubrobacteraceae bacterium]
MSGTAGGGDVVLDGGPGRDVLDASGASGSGVVLRGGDGPDELSGPVGPAVLDGGEGDDAIDDGGGGAATVLGGAGADAIVVSGAGSSVDAGPGDDEVDGSGAAGPVRIDAGPGSNVVQVFAAGSSVRAGDGPDVIDAAGGTGAVTIDAGNGDNRVDVGGDGSVVRSGGGRDVIDASSATGRVSIDAGAGNDTIDLGGVGSSVAGGDGDDAIDASGVVGAARIDGGAGADRIVVGGSGTVALGGAGNDQLDATDAGGPVVLDGGAGSDLLIGGDHADLLAGGDGDDRLEGGLGANHLDGGAGGDVLLAGPDGSPGEVLSGGGGYDTVSYENASDGVRVTVGAGADDGVPGEGDDVRGDVEQVVGTDGDDVLQAGPGGTTLVGSEGDDHLLGGPGPDVLLAGPGDDRLDGGPGVVRDEFEGGPGEDEITYGSRKGPLRIDMRSRVPHGGEAGEGDVYRDPIERIVGGAGADRIDGQSGVAHVVLGGAGDDVIRVTESARDAGDASADAVRCQGGGDRVESDALDDVAGDCERVLEDRFLTRALSVFATKPRVVVSPDGRRVRVRLGCDRKTLGYCSTKVVLRRPGTTRALARVERVRILPGRWRTVVLRAPGPRSARTLWRSKRVLVVAVVRDRIGRGSIAKRLATRARAPKRMASRTGRSVGTKGTGRSPSTGRGSDR